MTPMSEHEMQQPIGSNVAQSPSHTKLIGQPLPRVEDERLLRGKSRFVSDIAAGMNTLEVMILRSPHAHAKLLSIDTRQAQRLDGLRPSLQRATLKSHLYLVTGLPI